MEWLRGDELIGSEGNECRQMQRRRMGRRDAGQRGRAEQRRYTGYRGVNAHGNDGWRDALGGERVSVAG